MKMKIIERKGKKQYIIFPEWKSDREIIDAIKYHQACNMIVRIGKFSDGNSSQENVLIIMDGHKKIHNEKKA